LLNCADERLASGLLPPGWLASGQLLPPFAHAADGLRVALLTVEDTPEMIWHEQPPSQLSVLRLPDRSGGVCELIKRFSYASEEDVPSPECPLLWKYRTLLNPALSLDGSRLAYGELLRWEGQHERLCMWRLWAWDEPTDRRWLVAMRAEYVGAGEPERAYEMTAAGELVSRAADIDGWASWTQTLCALSPDGMSVAYVLGDELRVTRLPATVDRAE